MCYVEMKPYQLFAINQIWLWIDSVQNDTFHPAEDLYVEIYPTDQYLWSSKDRHMVHKYNYISNHTKVFVTSDRFMLHIYATDVAYIPSFIVNVSSTGWLVPDSHER